MRSDTAIGPEPGTAAAVGLGEGLVQVEVDDVEAHVARAGDAHDRVQVGAVVVQRRADPVHDRGDRLDVRIEDAERVRVGQHQTGDIGVRPCARRSSRSIPPRELVASLTTSRPAIVTVAGLVPCEVSGVRTLHRCVSPRDSWYARVSRSPASSPCEPAEGCSETCGSPDISASALCSRPHQLQRPLRAGRVLQRVQPSMPGQRRRRARADAGCASSCTTRADRSRSPGRSCAWRYRRSGARSRAPSTPAAVGTRNGDSAPATASRRPPRARPDRGIRTPCVRGRPSRRSSWRGHAVEASPRVMRRTDLTLRRHGRAENVCEPVDVSARALLGDRDQQSTTIVLAPAQRLRCPRPGLRPHARSGT